MFLPRMVWTLIMKDTVVSALMGNSLRATGRQRAFDNSLAGIHLKNGLYEDLGTGISPSNLWIVGQKDAKSGNAHPWIQNKSHTWQNVLDGKPVARIRHD